MLRQFGVKGVKVQEIVSLDDELLAILPSVVLPGLDLSILIHRQPAGLRSTIPLQVG
jgi:hypothetical protein